MEGGNTGLWGILCGLTKSTEYLGSARKHAEHAEGSTIQGVCHCETDWSGLLPPKYKSKNNPSYISILSGNVGRGLCGVLSLRLLVVEDFQAIGRTTYISRLKVVVQLQGSSTSARSLESCSTPTPEDRSTQVERYYVHNTIPIMAFGA